MTKPKKLTYEELEQENQTLKELLTYLAPVSWPRIADEIGEAERVAKKILDKYGPITTS